MHNYVNRVEATDSMIILVIGNGFDLAHGLPTRYTDFLDFCKTAQNINTGKNIEFVGKMKQVFELSGKLSNKGIPNNTCFELCKQVNALVTTNVWYEYLCGRFEKNKMSGENWIDFEREISRIIYYFDDLDQNLSNTIVDEPEFDINVYFQNLDVKSSSEEVFLGVFLKNVKNPQTCTFKDLRKHLHEDLKRLTKSFNIYCTSFIEEMLEKSPTEIISNSLFERIQASLLVSFNYTHTYQKMYGEKRSPRTFYPHGECNAEKYPCACDLVLGIDEYWTDGRKDTHTNYNVFKKYVQRIQKETYRAINGLFEAINEYRLTVDTSTPGEPKAYEDLSKEVELYFFGHSLDITDKDILYKLLSIKQVNCTIFCKDEETQGDYIANIVKIIGQDELIKRMEQGKIAFLISHE